MEPQGHCFELTEAQPNPQPDTTPGSQASSFNSYNFGFRVQGVGLRVQGLGFRV